MLSSPAVATGRTTQKNSLVMKTIAVPLKFSSALKNVEVFLGDFSSSHTSTAQAANICKGVRRAAHILHLAVEDALRPGLPTFFEPGATF